MRKSIVYILLLLSIQVCAQQDSTYTVTGNFQNDSFRIGERFQYCITLKYPKNQIAIVPDSSYSFSPFEYAGKVYFPTRTDDLYAYDSIIYILSGFEVVNKQYLFIPIWFTNKKDTITKYTERDSIFLRHLVQSTSETDLRDQSVLADIPPGINYPYILAGILSVIIILYGLYRLFGTIIIRRYRLFILMRSHNRFLKEFDTLTDDFIHRSDIRIIEQTLALWKSYLARMEVKPINTYTTKELILLYEQEDLEATLQSLDRNVYGGTITEDVSEALQVLKRFTTRRFQKRRRELIDG